MTEEIRNEIIAESSTSWWDECVSAVTTSNPLVDLAFAVGGAILGVALWEGGKKVAGAVKEKVEEKKAEEPKKDEKAEEKKPEPEVVNQDGTTAK